MTVSIRPITSEEVPAFRTVISQAFGGDPTEDGDERFLQQVDLERTYAAFEGEQMVATAAAFTFDVTIPGGTAPMGGLTMVAVRPTHRRQGVLRRLIDAHFADVGARDEPLSGLWASETSIYGRFGYGNAVPRHHLAIDAKRTALDSALATDVVRLIDETEARSTLPAIYDAYRTGRVAALSRSDDWWAARRFYDGPEHREGASKRRYAVAERDGVAVGYVMYRQKEKWDDGWLPDGEVGVIEVIGDRWATASLWRFLGSIDLFPRIEWWNAPVDDPVRWMAGNGRAVRITVADSLWVRLLDVDRCLALRRYRAPGEIAIGVTDTLRPANSGVRRLTIGADGTAEVTATADRPSVELDVATLGALYLGGRSAVEFGAAGLLEGDEASVRQLDELMRWDPPWCPEVF